MLCDQNRRADEVKVADFRSTTASRSGAPALTDLDGEFFVNGD